MINSITILLKSQRIECPATPGNHKMTLDLSTIGENAFDIEIVFNSSVSTFRNHDFRFVKPDKTRVSNAFSPKAVRLESGHFVQPNRNVGIWEISPDNRNRLLWRFNPDGSAPITTYSGAKNDKIIAAASLDLPKTLELLFSTTGAIEFSRSPLAFSAIACFTDHCDFDTPESLRLQRDFFASCNIKTTKGFFLNHYSKRDNNASFQNDADELMRWRADGHELAYHSLSQSIKGEKESLADFEDFAPPFSVPTWIDHGYQPYNLSLYKNHNISDRAYADTLQSKQIKTLWNYIDSGTATRGVINQLNPGDFTLGRFAKGNSDLTFKRRMSLAVKNIIFHYYADEKMIGAYKSAAAAAKSVIYKRDFTKAFPMLRSLIILLKPIFGVLLFWKRHKNRPYKLAKYAPIAFKHTISGQPFTIFQTIEMIDFKKSLHPENIARLVRESGVFVAHTYFSAPMAYHTGRMFSGAGQIDPGVEANFRNLGAQIKMKNIWNPTLNELAGFLAIFEKAELDVSEDGNIFVKTSGVPHRKIN